MTRTVWFALFALSIVVPASAQDVTFKSDLTQYIMNGDKTDKRDVSITVKADSVVVTPKKGDAITIPFSAITGMIYDRRSKMRRMAPTYGKAQDHFLTIQYKPTDGAGQFVEIEMGKDAAPRVVATLEARSGKKIERIVGS